MIGNDQTIAAVLALINNAGFGDFVVVENEEGVAEKIHLQNGLLHRHGLDGEGLALFVLCKEWVENDGMDPSEELV